MANTTAPGAFLPWPGFNFGDVKQQAKTAAAEVKRLQAEIEAAGKSGSAVTPDLVKRLQEAEQLRKNAKDAVKEHAEAKKQYKDFKLFKGLYTASALKSAAAGDIEDAAIMFLSEKMTDPKFLKRVSKAGKIVGFKDLGATLGDVIPYVGLASTAYHSAEKAVKSVKADETGRMSVMEQARKGYLSRAERDLWQTTFEKYIGGGAENADAMLKQLQTTAEKVFATDKMQSWMGQRASGEMQRVVAEKQKELGRLLTDAERKRVLHEAYAKMVNSDAWLAASVVDDGGKTTSQERAAALEKEADTVALKEVPQAPAMKTATVQYEEQRKAFLETWFWDSRKTSTRDLTRGVEEREARTRTATTESKTETLLNDGSFSALINRVREYAFGGLRPQLADKY